ncbi:BQ2448_7182 [Microbotryum intermedium]|uniref:BQ2448_7182 protein n=1 Tax=Microbotryum intermedium TaxID=269621 RepID=A0A238FJ37_9BASI|nr:BQ2448_7182 [Microbotryum intermedium]
MTIRTTNLGRTHATTSSWQQPHRHRSNGFTSTSRSETRFQEDFGIGVGIDLPTRTRPTSWGSGTTRSGVVASVGGAGRHLSGTKYASTLSRSTEGGNWTTGMQELTTSKEYQVDLSMVTRGQRSGFASSNLEDGASGVRGTRIESDTGHGPMNSNAHQISPTSKNMDIADLRSITPTAHRHRRSLRWVFVTMGISVCLALLSTALVCALLRRPNLSLTLFE